jgi:hypothetical protein
LADSASQDPTVSHSDGEKSFKTLFMSYFYQFKHHNFRKRRRNYQNVKIISLQKPKNEQILVFF